MTTEESSPDLKPVTGRQGDREAGMGDTTHTLRSEDKRPTTTPLDLCLGLGQAPLCPGRVSGIPGLALPSLPLPPRVGGERQGPRDCAFEASSSEGGNERLWTGQGHVPCHTSSEC